MGAVGSRLRYHDRRLSASCRPAKTAGPWGRVPLPRAWLTCYRFMYYDVLLATVPIAVLLCEPLRVFHTRVFDLNLARHAPGTEGADRTLPAPHTPRDPSGPRLVGYVNSFPLTILAALYILDNTLLSLNVEATVGVGGWAPGGRHCRRHHPRHPPSASRYFPPVPLGYRASDPLVGLVRRAAHPSAREGRYGA